MYLQFLDQLDHVKVKKKVSKNLEVTKYLIKHMSKPVYFEDLDGFKAVGNIWAKRQNFERVLNQADSKTFKLKFLNSINNPEKYEIVENSEFLNNSTTDFSMLELPIPKYFKDDGSNYITSGIVFSEYKGKRNVSYHRFMILDDKSAAIRLVPRHLNQMYCQSREEGNELKFALVIGAHPTHLLAAATSVEYEVDEAKIASAIRLNCLNEREKMVRLKNRISVPVEAEYVFEGVITEKLIDLEGPFVDIMRTYDSQRNQPIVRFERMYTIKDPVFHLLLPGGLEHYHLMGLPREPVMFRAIKNASVDVLDLRLTEGGSNWLHGVVKIRKKKEDDGKTAIYAAFKGHKSLKHVIVVDEDIDIYNEREIEWAFATRFQGDKDMVQIRERGSSLDPSRYEDDITTKLGFDATMPLDRKENFKKLF